MDKREHEKLKKAYEEIRKKEIAFSEMAKQFITEGNLISWEKQRGCRQYGRVTIVSDNGRVKVENAITHKEYWIEFYSITGGSY